MHSRGTLLAVLLAAACSMAACSTTGSLQPSDLGPGYDDPVWTSGGDGKDDTSANATVHSIQWDGFVLVPTDADDGAIAFAIQRQVKSAIGALFHGPALMIRDRDARSNLDSSTWRRETLTVTNPDGTTAGTTQRITYHYQDLALVPNSLGATVVTIPLLFGDYVATAAQLIPDCADDPTTEADSLWYHYDPTASACANDIATEADAIDTASALLHPGQIAAADTQRRFLQVRASLGPAVATKTTYPEYDRLWGFGGSDRQKIVVYSFFGVDADDQDPRDNGIIEELRYLRTLRAAFPGLAVVDTEPFALLEDFTLNGQALPPVDYATMADWVIDGTSWPAGADAAGQQSLLTQVRDKFHERWIVWQLPVTATRNGETRHMTLEVRMYWGREDGTPEWRQAARNRYLEAFWNADVFSYTGHSHFGHGPLEPVEYNAGNFPDRYQVMLFNSCLSYNYYDVDFLEMHPGGAANLDVVSNGLPAYWNGMGESTAKYVISLVNAKVSWADLLKSMRVTLPSIGTDYDPMRAATGEQGNLFDPAQGAITVSF
jgi:hypothetical protein